ncbi:NUDIX hydrolase [Tuberibacillus sp. Marseille-P3662]|uniref:NUDIX hydrolase n=1 Tax=Tuberibacillus sp. Marseille-P3662 TaxID=1965358 RepID=UPI000A1C97ED|nr:NUDIX hydrolase [Tuberibacillus sp. Marseille-P3662]
MVEEPQWLQYAKQLQAIAQAGLHYGHDAFDKERYEQIRAMSVDIMSRYTELDEQKVRDLFANESGYQTPKIDIRAVVFKDDAILLVREKSDGQWCLPGGWADIGFTLSENVRREAKEEAGIDVQPKRILAVHDTEHHNVPIAPYGIYKLFVQCDGYGGDFQTNIETSDAQFFPYNQLPPLSEGRTNHEQLKMCFEARDTSTFEPDFD